MNESSTTATGPQRKRGVAGLLAAHAKLNQQIGERTALSKGIKKRGEGLKKRAERSAGDAAKLDKIGAEQKRLDAGAPKREKKIADLKTRSTSVEERILARPPRKRQKKAA